ncbi:MAG: ATPase [Nitrospiraceae bacterium]|nr:MAG: ATPase [Nitrospiraceae bacterium]
MKKIIFITPRDAEYGFSLAGVEHHAVDDKDARQVLQKMISDADAGVVAVDERLLKDYPWEKLKELESSFQGVFLVLPSPERAAAGIEDYASRLIRQAIGYHVRL